MTRKEIDQTLMEVEAILPTLSGDERVKVESLYSIVKILDAITLGLAGAHAHAKGTCGGKG